jgi:hypothetical protein
MQNILKTGFCLHLRVEPTQLGPTHRVSLFLDTSTNTQWDIYIEQAQHKPTTKVNANIKNITKLHKHEA